MKSRLFQIALSLAAGVCCAAPPQPKFLRQELDRIALGYGVAVADVDGDRRPDIILADQHQFVWYQNPGVAVGRQAAGWRKHLLAENLSKNDNICVAAADIDGDGKCEIAVGADWNPTDTDKSGAVYYLVPPADRTQPWSPFKLPNTEPTPRRMAWLKLDEKNWALVVVPLHGRGNKNNAGPNNAKSRLYFPPAGDVRVEWKHLSVDQSMHAINALHLTQHPGSDLYGILLGGKEGLVYIQPPKWERAQLWEAAPTVKPPAGVGEARTMNVVGEGKSRNFIVTVEPMQGNQLVIYHPPPEGKNESVRQVISDKLIQGHALACGDLLDIGSDQIVAGWGGNAPGDKVGIHLWTPLDAKAEKWAESVVDDNQMACEDLQLADLDGDGDLDIVASGRATKNLVIYWNETPRQVAGVAPHSSP